MVWSTTQSALYNDLSRYYEDDKKPRRSCENSNNSAQNSPEKCNEKLPEKCENKCPENCGNNYPEKCGNKFPEKCPKKHDKKPEKNCEDRDLPVCQNCPCNRQTPTDQISKIISDKFSDKDMLLIAGLIFLLMKQGADKKLILALAFVLLS